MAAGAHARSCVDTLSRQQGFSVIIVNGPGLSDGGGIWALIKDGRICPSPLLVMAAIPRSLSTISSGPSAMPQDSRIAGFPSSYLVTGYFSTMIGAVARHRGQSQYVYSWTDGKDDESRPAIPGERDRLLHGDSAGHFWMNQVPAQCGAFADYRQTLNMKEATLTTNYRYVDHERSTQIQVTTLSARPRRIRRHPYFHDAGFRRRRGTVVCALNPWAPHQPRPPLAKLTGEQMQEAVAANEYAARGDRAGDS